MNAVPGLKEPAASLQQEISSIRWFHQIDLGNGIVTPGEDESERKWKKLCVPDLRGKTFLDVGAWDGFFSFKAERLGASRVLATDSFIWQGGSWGSKRGFDLAKRVIGSKVEELLIDPLDLSPERVGQWDVVLFSGVLYHMKYPLLSLERAASVTREMIIVETALDMLFHRRPAMAFYEGSELSQDETNWCGPNHAAVKAMLRTAGFKRIEVAYNRSLPMRAARAAKRLFKGEYPLSAVQKGRATYHAWK